MHELGKMIQALMGEESMRPADLVRRSGLSRQHVSSLLNDAELSRMPEARTFRALSQAFPAVRPSSFVLAAAQAAGVLSADEVVTDYDDLSNDALLGILRSRLDRGGQSDAGTAEAQKSPDDVEVPVLHLHAARTRKEPRKPRGD